MKAKSQPPKDPHLYSTRDEWQLHHEIERTNPWHHLPLALVALPPLLSIVHGRAENWSDAILLLLVAFYLYQLVKVPWEMYYASQTRTVLPSSISPEADESATPEQTAIRNESAARLRRNELVALLSTAVVPWVGAYLLHYVRGLLSDPDRYVNDTLINMFMIATLVKPLLHFVTLIKNQSLYHQEVVHYPSTEVFQLKQKVSKLESDLVQLSRAFATKSDVRALRDGVDVPLSQLSKAIRRFNKKEEYLRLTSEEKFSLLEQRLEQVVEVGIKQQEVLEGFEREREEERERRKKMLSGASGGSGDGEFARFLGRLLGTAVTVPLPRGAGGGEGKKQLSWYERGLTWYLFWPVNLPKKAVGWAVDKAGKAVRGIEQGYVEEKKKGKELEFASSVGGTGTTSTTSKRNKTLNEGGGGGGGGGGGTTIKKKKHHA